MIRDGHASISEDLCCRWLSTSTNMKMLSLCSMLCEVTNERVFRRFSSIALRIQWEGNVKENGHATAGIFCKTINTLVHRSLVTMKYFVKHIAWLLSVCHILQTCHHLTVRVFTTENCSERTIRKHWGSHCKSDKSTDRGVKKWFARRLPIYKTNSMVWVRERTIPTERPPLVGEVIANFCG
jgi:hypothetical protein